MIKKLKKRPRSDSFGAEAPRSRRKWDRTVYLVMLTAFGVALANYVAGDILFMRADGLVMRERSVVAATTLVRVSNVDVSPGQAVRKGDVLLQAESFEILDRIAELSMRDAELAEREASLRTQQRLAENLLPLSIQRSEELNQTRGVLDTPQVSGLVTATRRESVLEDLYVSNVERMTLITQAEGLVAELDAVIDTRAHAKRVLDDLSEHYSSGVYQAGKDGVIGDTVPAPGEVFNPGEPILTILSGTPYVLAYLPSNHLFEIRNGDRIVVTGGNLRYEGIVERILPVSQSIPDEFRNAFRLDETRQLARVRLDTEARFPIFSAVRITRRMPWSDLRKAMKHAFHASPFASWLDNAQS